MSVPIVNGEKIEALIRSFICAAEAADANLLELSQAARCVYAAACIDIEDSVLALVERRSAEDPGPTSDEH